MAPKQPTSPISDTRGVGDSSAASVQEDPIDRRGRGALGVCPPVLSGAWGATHTHTYVHTLGDFPVLSCPVLPRCLTTHPVQPKPTPYTHTPPLTLPLPQPLTPSCGFDVQLPPKQGTPLQRTSWAARPAPSDSLEKLPGIPAHLQVAKRCVYVRAQGFPGPEGYHEGGWMATQPSGPARMSRGFPIPIPTISGTSAASKR